MIDLPKPPIADPELLETWQDWIQDRKERGIPLTSVAARRQLRLLDKWGKDKFIQSIDNSINYKWIGLFEPRNMDGAQSQPIWAQIKNLEREIAGHPANHESLSFDPTCSEAVTNDLLTKRKSLYSLRIQHNGTTTYPSQS